MQTKRQKILCLDDETALGEVLGSELAATGYDAAYLDSKIVGLKWIAKHKPDLVFTDIRSWDLDGFEFLKRLRADSEICNTSVCMLTGNATIQCAIESKKLGAVDFISKPYELNDLLSVVAHILHPNTAAQTPGKIKIVYGARRDRWGVNHITFRHDGDQSSALDEMHDAALMMQEHANAHRSKRERLSDGIDISPLVNELKLKYPNFSSVITPEYLVFRIQLDTSSIPSGEGTVLSLADKIISQFQGR